MPSFATPSNARSASGPKYTGSSTESNVVSSNPAASKILRTRSGSANDTGEGASAGGVGKSRPAASAARISVSQSFRAISRQHSNATRPPGFSARPTLANAATGSSKNIDPNRLIATSN